MLTLHRAARSQRQNLNPRFDETFAFIMTRHGSCRIDALEVEVFDWNPVTKDTSLGKATINLSTVFANGWHVSLREQFSLETCDNSPAANSIRSDVADVEKTEDRGGPGYVWLALDFIPDTLDPPR